VTCQYIVTFSQITKLFLQSGIVKNSSQIFTEVLSPKAKNLLPSVHTFSQMIKLLLLTGGIIFKKKNRSQKILQPFQLLELEKLWIGGFIRCSE